MCRIEKFRIFESNNVVGTERVVIFVLTTLMPKFDQNKFAMDTMRNLFRECLGTGEKFY